MNKLWATVILTLLLASGVIAQNKTDREHDLLIGPVKSIRIETADLAGKPGAWKEKSRDLLRVVDYDPSGNMTKETIYLNRPAITRISYRYDKEGNRSENIVIESPPGPSPHRSLSGYREGSMPHEDPRNINLARRVFRHDSDGNRVEEVINSNTYRGAIQTGTAISAIYRHAYDRKGQRKESIYEVAGLAVRRWVYEYNESGNVAEMAIFTGGGHLLLRETYQYQFDRKGNWTRRATSRWKDRGSESYFEPEEVTYRRIDYY